MPREAVFLAGHDAHVIDRLGHLVGCGDAAGGAVHGMIGNLVDHGDEVVVAGGEVGFGDDFDHGGPVVTGADGDTVFTGSTLGPRPSCRPCVARGAILRQRRHRCVR